MSWVPDFFYNIYEELETACSEHARWVGKKAEEFYATVSGAVDTVIGTVTYPAQWIFEALQGDFNDNRTIGQIAADSVLSMVPFIDQLLDVRDICANCKKLSEDISDKEAWLNFVLTLIGLIPGLGSLVKGVLKIVFVSIRRVGARQIDVAINASIEILQKFLHDEKILKVLGTYDIAKSLNLVADKLRVITKTLTPQLLKERYDILILEFEALIRTMSKVLPASAIDNLQAKHQFLSMIQKDFDKHIGEALGPAHQLCERVADGLARKADEIAHGGENALTNANTVRTIDKYGLSREDVNKLTKTQKGLFGEKVSDEYMKAHDYKFVTDEDRPRVHDLFGSPHAKGIDGVYKKPKSETGYVVTEAKFRGAGKFYPNSQLPKLADGTTQMDDRWIQGRLKDAVGPINAANVIKQGYDPLVLVVDETGEVVKIHKLDNHAKVIETITP